MTFFAFYNPLAESIAKAAVDVVTVAFLLAAAIRMVFYACLTVTSLFHERKR